MIVFQRFFIEIPGVTWLINLSVTTVLLNTVLFLSFAALHWAGVVFLQIWCQVFCVTICVSCTKWWWSVIGQMCDLLQAQAHLALVSAGPCQSCDTLLPNSLWLYMQPSIHMDDVSSYSNPVLLCFHESLLWTAQNWLWKALISLCPCLYSSQTKPLSDTNSPQIYSS